ncbi:MAG: hypothetical protein JOZ54_24040 [Acidobacteria bacterium]|nr:hypothetical protein [Acidobacteriota bacterium]
MSGRPARSAAAIAPRQFRRHRAAAVPPPSRRGSSAAVAPPDETSVGLRARRPRTSRTTIT